MTTLSRLFIPWRRIVAAVRGHRSPRERYFAESVDFADLEWRMRAAHELDRQRYW